MADESELWLDRENSVCDECGMRIVRIGAQWHHRDEPQAYYGHFAVPLGRETSTRLWVDVMTGTYGRMEDIRIIEFKENEQKHITEFEEGADSTRILFGNTFGYKIE